MAYTRLDKLLTLGTAAERAAFTPDPPAGVVSIWHESDTGDHYAWSGSAWVQVNGSGGGGGSGAYEVADWAALLALTGVPDGRAYTVLAPVCSGPGAIPGTRWMRAASLTPTGWITAGGQRLAAMNTQIDGLVNTSEQTIWEPLFEAGVLASVQEIRMRARWIAAGADTNTKTSRWRLRDTGAGNVELGRYQSIVASARWWQAPAAIHVTGATSALPAGVIAPTSALPQDQSLNSATASLALVLPDLTATPIYLGATVQLGASPLAVPSLSAASIYVE